MQLYLSRQANGLYMLTEFEPIKSLVGTTDNYDLYVKEGDSIGIRNLCNVSLYILNASRLNKLETVKVELSGKLV